MPRTRKTRQGSTPEDQGAQSPSTGEVAGASEEPAAESRPSQLEKIRAAIGKPAEADAPPELEAPEQAAELPAHQTEALAELESHIDQPEEAPADAPAPAVEAPGPEPAAPPVAAAVPPHAVWVPPPTQPPSGARAGMMAAVSDRPTSSLALGIVLVVVGLFFLVIRLFEIDLGTYGWPLYVIIPGLTLIVVGFVSVGTGAIIPGAIVTATGLVLAYQSATGDWASWTYAWALIAPGSVGAGIFFDGLRNRNPKQLRQGRSLMFWSLMIFLIGFVLFESILNISGVDYYGKLGQAALPALLIVIGVTLLARSYRRSRGA